MTTDYIAYCDWKRNHGAMRDWKLLDTLREYEMYRKSGSLTDAVYRVMQNGGDIEDNYRHCLEHARQRGLVAR